MDTTGSEANNKEEDTSDSKPDEKPTPKPENVWHDVVVVKSTSFTVNYYLEKLDAALKSGEESVDLPDQVMLLLFLV